MNLRLRLALEWIIIGILASLAVVAAHLWNGTNGFDNLFYDQLSSISRPKVDQNIMVVAIDDPSLRAIGKWPWPRKTHAKLIEKLNKAQVRSITFDILLSEDSDLADDTALAIAMSRPTPVTLPLHFITPGSDGKSYESVPPAPVFRAAAKAVGHVNLVFDSDGIVRRTEVCFAPDDGPKWPHLMEQTYRVANGSVTPSPAYQRQKCGETLLIPYANRGSYPEISYSDLLTADLPTELLKDRDIIVGATAAGMGDNYPTPYADGGLLPGAEIMANILNALRTDHFVTPLPSKVILIFWLIPMWVLLIGFLRWRPRTALLASLALVGLTLLSSAAALMWGFWFPPGGALLGLLIIYPLWGWRRLQAMSDFMAAELGVLEREGESSPLPVLPSRATDMVGRQSEALAGAIDHMRDLRRFIADTLADLPDPMFVTDPDGMVTLTNKRLDERLGLNIVGLSTEKAFDIVVSSPYRAAVDQYLMASAVSDSREFIRFVSPRGRTLVMRRAPIESETGELSGYIHYLADITALATAEKEREQVLELLSHDMRAPQSAIIALLDGEIGDDERKRIAQNANRTMQLAQDFVDLARMAETEFSGEDALFADLILEISDNFWPLAKERNIEIRVKDHSDNGFILAETDSLDRAIANLIDNAIKFSPDRGVITVDVNRVIDNGQSFLVATICDDGPGIADNILPHLFTRFATGNAHQGRIKGTGLGLNFVVTVIERHGGTIKGENRTSGGACFTIVLPEAPDNPGN